MFLKPALPLHGWAWVYSASCSLAALSHTGAGAERPRR